METSGLRLYIQPRNNARAHFVRQYPDGKIYIFCNRYFGDVSGQILTLEEGDAVTYRSWQHCSSCQAAIEAAVERAAVLVGLHPQETALYSERVREAHPLPIGK